MLKKYTRTNRKLFGLRFHEPLFGGRAVVQRVMREAECPVLTMRTK
jgi:hypothetical protein